MLVAFLVIAGKYQEVLSKRSGSLGWLQLSLKQKSSDTLLTLNIWGETSSNRLRFALLPGVVVILSDVSSSSGNSSSELKGHVVAHSMLNCSEVEVVDTHCLLAFDLGMLRSMIASTRLDAASCPQWALLTQALPPVVSRASFQQIVRNTFKLCFFSIPVLILLDCFLDASSVDTVVLDSDLAAARLCFTRRQELDQFVDLVLERSGPLCAALAHCLRSNKAVELLNQTCSALQAAFPTCSPVIQRKDGWYIRVQLHGVGVRAVHSGCITLLRMVETSTIVAPSNWPPHSSPTVSAPPAAANDVEHHEAPDSIHCITVAQLHNLMQTPALARSQLQQGGHLLVRGCISIALRGVGSHGATLPSMLSVTDTDKDIQYYPQVSNLSSSHEEADQYKMLELLRKSVNEELITGNYSDSADHEFGGSMVDNNSGQHNRTGMGTRRRIVRFDDVIDALHSSVLPVSAARGGTDTQCSSDEDDIDDSNEQSSGDHRDSKRRRLSPPSIRVTLTSNAVQHIIFEDCPAPVLAKHLVSDNSSSESGTMWEGLLGRAMKRVQKLTSQGNKVSPEVCDEFLMLLRLLPEFDDDGEQVGEATVLVLEELW